uniref:hypothetical protein n=1 Tax=Alistipes sp. TaxID=1872444 RepID=UPI004056C5AF
MKNLFKTLVLCGVSALVGGWMSSCVPTPDGSETFGPAKLELAGEATVNTAVSVDIPIVAENLEKVAFMLEEYVVKENGEEWVISGYNANKEPIYKRKVEVNPALHLIFNAAGSKRGKTFEAPNIPSVLHISGNEGLDKSKKFVVYIAGIDKSKNYYNKGEVLTVKFETPEKYSDDDVTVIRENFEGIDVFVKVPERIIEQNRRVRWGVGNKPTIIYNGNPPMVEAVYLCDYVYPASIIARDTTLNINHYNAYRRNEKGEIGYYIAGNNKVTEVSADSNEALEGIASPIQYYYHFQPGEPLVLFLAEADYCSPETGLEPTVNFSFGNDIGWYWFPYHMDKYIEDAYKNPSTNPEDYWYTKDKDGYDGWHRQVELRLPGPGQFNGSVAVDVSGLSSHGGTITLTPDDKTFIYMFGLFEERDAWQSGFLDITDRFFGGDQSLWQWFTTAEMAPYFNVSYFYAAEGPQEIKLENFFTSLTAGGKYHIVVNAMGATTDNYGELIADTSLQNFQHIEFQLKEYSLPEPELVITPVEPYSPWKVKFNVKNPDYATNPVKKVAFAANYTREFKSYMAANQYTYSDLVMFNASLPYYCLSDTDVAMVNSAAGAEVEYDVMENSAFTVAMIGWNDEGRASNPDKEGSQGVAEARSLNIIPEDRLPGMDKLEALKGDWTASATVSLYNYETGESTKTLRSWKVSIGDLKTNNTLTDADYAVFEAAGVSKDAADAYLAEFNQKSTEYNATVTGQNRVLCLGWAVDDERTVSLASPWDLFLMTDYNASIVDYLFQDFGPKWFLQVNADGDVFVPVNYNRVPNLTKWYNGMNHHLCLGNYESGYAFYYDPTNPESVESVGIPVEISADGNTVTLKSQVVNFEDDKGNSIPVNFYPNIMYDYNGLQFYNSYTISDVVLKKGWSENTLDTPTPAKMSSVTTVNSKAVKSANGASYTTPKAPYSSTTFVPQPKKAKVANIKQVTPEERQKGMEQYLKRTGLTSRIR